MNVGFVGFGKLGAPVGLAIESRGHNVMAYDTNPDVERYFAEGTYPHTEEGLLPLLSKTKITFVNTVSEVVTASDIVFCPIQTPHEPQYEGTTRIPEDRADFDYTYLENALSEISDACARLAVRKTVAVISTCLPGTFEGRLKGLLAPNIDYVYTPQFIAMGNVIDDYLNPEFNLIGVESEEAADQLEHFYATINDAPNVRTDVTTAEGIKVSYNTWITAKTVIANAWGELAERAGMNFDDIKRAWDLSTKRLVSTRYTDAGMSDGGGCHPRDNIAMSWLADEVGMSHNLWEDLMEAREQFEEWHADLAAEFARMNNLPLVILGRSFKPETDIEVGSPSLLVSNILTEKEVPHTHVEDLPGVPEPAVYFIGTKHDRYQKTRFPRDSIVIDPFRYIPRQSYVQVFPIGGTL